jgi:hypothetical protein
MLKEKIKKILIENPETRNSDTELLIKYCESLGIILTETQKEQFRKYKIGNDSPRRCRQNLQVEYPELKADKEVQKYRKIKEKEMINIYGSNPAYLPPLEHYTNMF